MTASVTFNRAAAEAAEDREENGVTPQPGDRDLVEALDGWRGQAWDAYWQPIYQAEQREQNRLWLTQQCPGCEDGGTGEPCNEHCYCGRPATSLECISCHNDIELAIVRAGDL